MHTNSGTVIWAVDPFDPEQRPLSSAVHELAQWVERAGLRLQPVYVVSPGEKQLEAGEVPPLPAIEAELGRYLQRYPLRGEVRPRVLFGFVSLARKHYLSLIAR